jgi:TolA-binding protein
MMTRFWTAALLATLSFASVSLGGAAHAQSAIEGRVDRLEREMRAVQRKVFPGGNGQYFPPEITPPEQTAPAPGVPATSPVADLTARVAALETQLSTMTGQVEQNQYKLRQLEDAFAAYKRATDARLKAIEDAAAPPPLTGASTAPAGAPTTTPPPAKPATADPARAKAVAAVEKPATGDPAEDGYVYGYRLWSAKYYAEAETQLGDVVAKYPKHRRASWAQNLLGRAYLDDNQPQQAARAFLTNYQRFPEGERTPDSLYYLTVALKKLGKPSADICKVYAELEEVYAAKLTPQLKADVARGRAAEKCKP